MKSVERLKAEHELIERGLTLLGWAMTPWRRVECRPIFRGLREDKSARSFIPRCRDGSSTSWWTPNDCRQDPAMACQ